MSTTNESKGYKTLAIRLNDDVHAQLQLVARLQQTSIAAEIGEAIRAYLEAKRSDPELSKRAASVLEDIEREANVRQQAIAELFAEPTGVSSAKSSRTKRGVGASSVGDA